MFNKNNRVGKRENDQLRDLKITYDVYSYTPGSVLFEMGATKILCSVTLQNSVPHFLRGKRKGWLTAEYSLLPAATPIRTVREVSANKRNGRTIEISRLIGRALRAVSNLNMLGENTMFIDCDVMQADGGTRTACIIAAYMAVKAAQKRLLDNGDISYPILTDEIASVSVGIGPFGPIIDMDFTEDGSVYADYNFVVTRSNKLIEVQGTSEYSPINWDDFLKMQPLVEKASKTIFDFYDENQYSNELKNDAKSINNIYSTSSYRDMVDYL